MKIVHATSVHRWNDVRIYHKMCRSLVSAGHEVHLVAAAPVEGPRPTSSDGVILHFIERGRGRIGRVLGTARSVVATALGLAPDIVHFHDPELLPYFAATESRYNSRVVYDVHEDHRVSVVDRSWAPPGLRRALGWGVGFAEDRCSRRFAAIVAATPRIASRFAKHRQVGLVQNFPEIESAPSPESQHLSRVAGRFVYIGGLSAGRCVEEMIDSVGEAGHPASLELAGPWESAKLAEGCRARPGWRRVVEHGFLGRPEVFRLMATAVAGLVLFRPLRNHVEAQPNKLFEYMLAGLPVIASDFPLWRSLIEPGRLGLLVNPESVSEIAGAMEWVMAHPEQAAEMGQRGRAAVLERYNWAGELKSLLEVYQRLAR